MRNKKIIALFIACLLLFVAVTSVEAGKPNKPGKKSIIYVDSDFTHPKKPSDGSRAFPYTTIQQGIDAASPGYTVFVFNGIYNENVVVNKSINLVGENRNSTIIDGGGSGNVVDITTDWVNISGFNIQNGINGIYFLLYSSSNNVISGNNVSNNDDTGILLFQGSHNNVISGNDVSNNTIYGIHLREFCNNNVVTGNYVSGNGVIGIAVRHDSDNNIVSGNNASNNHGTGIYLFYNSYNNTISSNKASYNTNYGIYLNRFSYNIISGNDILNNGYAGIYLVERCCNNIISGNDVSSNDDYGIYTYWDDNNNNTFYNNIFNTTLNNVYVLGNNIWNISKTPGTNIIGGNYLGGNYWSDYTGEDTDSDGLGDTPYNIPGGVNQDMYPLMIP